MSWLFAPAPLARVAVLRVVVLLFVPVDVLLTTTWVRGHAQVPGELYVPLRLGRLLPLPAFLLGEGEGDPGQWQDGLRLTGHFLERDAFGHLHRPLPPVRLLLAERASKLVA